MAVAIIRVVAVVVVLMVVVQAKLPAARTGEARVVTMDIPVLAEGCNRTPTSHVLMQAQMGVVEPEVSRPVARGSMVVAQTTLSLLVMVRAAAAGVGDQDA